MGMSKRQSHSSHATRAPEAAPAQRSASTAPGGARIRAYPHSSSSPQKTRNTFAPGEASGTAAGSNSKHPSSLARVAISERPLHPQPCHPLVPSPSFYHSSKLSRSVYLPPTALYPLVIFHVAFLFLSLIFSHCLVSSAYPTGPVHPNNRLPQPGEEKTFSSCK